jgi:hypothetical protein
LAFGLGKIKTKCFTAKAAKKCVEIARKAKSLEAKSQELTAKS